MQLFKTKINHRVYEKIRCITTKNNDKNQQLSSIELHFAIKHFHFDFNGNRDFWLFDFPSHRPRLKTVNHTALRSNKSWWRQRDKHQFFQLVKWHRKGKGSSHLAVCAHIRTWVRLFFLQSCCSWWTHRSCSPHRGQQGSGQEFPRDDEVRGRTPRMRWEVDIDEGGFGFSRRRWRRKKKRTRWRRRKRRRSWILLYLLHLVWFCTLELRSLTKEMPPKCNFCIPFHVLILQYLTDGSLL